MGGSSKPQTTTTNTDPWKGQQPYLIKGFSEAGRIYDQGPQSYFPGQTYADMSDPTKAGLQAQTQLASGGNPLIGNASSYVTNTLGGQSDNPYSSILGSGVGGMQATARGDFLNANPYLDQAYNQAAGKVSQTFNDETIPAIASGLGLSGMAGSTTSELLGAKAGGELSDSLAGLASNIYGGNYQAERDRMSQAQSGLTSTGAGLYGTGVNERLSTLSQAPGIREAQFGDAAKLQEAGQAYEGQTAKEIEDQINRYNYNQNAPMAALQDYMAMIQGNYGGTSTQTAKAASGSGLQQGIGAAISLASLFSDRRLKTIRAHVATTPDGLKLYSFTYRGQPDIVHVGLIAQEVEDIYPQAVYDDPVSGFKKVDYGRALANSGVA
jgi:hypothetical protein